MLTVYHYGMRRTLQLIVGKLACKFNLFNLMINFAELVRVCVAFWIIIDQTLIKL